MLNSSWHVTGLVQQVGDAFKECFVLRVTDPTLGHARLVAVSRKDVRILDLRKSKTVSCLFETAASSGRHYAAIAIDGLDYIQTAKLMRDSIHRRPAFEDDLPTFVTIEEEWERQRALELA